jgi:hypothetical protein
MNRISSSQGRQEQDLIKSRGISSRDDRSKTLVKDYKSRGKIAGMTGAGP